MAFPTNVTSVACYTPPTPVSTMSEWGLMLLGLLAVGLDIRQVHRRT